MDKGLAGSDWARRLWGWCAAGRIPATAATGGRRARMRLAPKEGRWGLPGGAWAQFQAVGQTV
jgi:hypothetical protein